MGEEREGALVGRQLGTYGLLRLIGAGGMAEVYLAQDINLERQVAVKVLPHVLAADPAYVARFRDEGRRVANLNHPHIVPVYSAGEQDGLLYMVMPFFQESLRDRMQRAGRPSPSQAISLVLQIADALAAAHQVGIVHRDVKPENILIDPDGQAVLTDFGVARELHGPLWDGKRITHISNGLPVGTPEYMAPEQFVGRKVGPQADIYALGTVLYELLVGYPPREADNPEGVISITLARRSIVPPAERTPGIWPSLNRAVMVALEYEPVNRYPDMEQFSDALTRSLTVPDEPALPASARAMAQLAAAPPTPHVPEVVGGHEDGRQIASAVPPVWAASYLDQVESDGWRRFWRSGLIALLLLGVAGASLVGILHAREPGQATPPSTIVSRGPGGMGAGVSGGTGTPAATGSVGVNAIPVTTQQTATTTITSTPTATATEPAPTSTPAPPLVYYPAGSSGGPQDQTMPKASGTPPSCSVRLTLINSTGSSRSWQFTAGPTTSAWSYSVQGSSPSTFSQTLPHGAVQPYSTNIVNIAFAQTAGQGNACVGPAGFAPVTITLDDDAASQSWSFTISHG